MKQQLIDQIKLRVKQSDFNVEVFEESELTEGQIKLFNQHPFIYRTKTFFTDVICNGITLYVRCEGVDSREINYAINMAGFTLNRR